MPYTLSTNQLVQSPAKGQLDEALNINIFPCQVDASQVAALLPGAAVSLVDNANGVPTVIETPDSTTPVFGYVVYNIRNKSFPALAPVEIAAEGTVIYLESSAAIARGANVAAVPTGDLVQTAVTGNVIVGFAYDQAQAANQPIRVYLRNFSGGISA